MNLKIFLGLFLFVGAIILGVLFFIFGLNFSRNIELLELQETGQEKGYLFQVTEKKTGVKYYLVSDKKISEGENESSHESGLIWKLNSENYEFEYLDESYLWNPGSCAKMPSVVDDLGNIYMIDVQYVGDGFEKKFIVYNRNENSKKYVDITKNDVPDEFKVYGDKMLKANVGADGVLEVAMPEPENFPTDFLLDTTDVNIYVVGKF
jgi:hypothetical protein